MSWITDCKKKAKALPVELRRKFVEEIWRGKTIGDARAAVGIEFDEAVGIIELNLVCRKILLPPDQVK